MILAPCDENIARAALALRSGSLVAFPTETVYGLGADARSSAAVRRIFSIKRRPCVNPLIVHVSSYERISQAALVEDKALIQKRLEKVRHLWPGPLSVVLFKHPDICPEVAAGGATVAVRIPNHAVALELLSSAAIPVAAPSANVSTQLSPTQATDVVEAFGDSIDIVLDGGPCRVGLESTVVNFTAAQIEVLRPGGITWETLHALFGEELLPFTAKRTLAAKNPLPSPGLLPLHYAPRTPLNFLERLSINELHGRVGLITFSPKTAIPIQFDFCERTCLSSSGDLEEVAAKLFSTLRRYDSLQLDLIAIDACERSGIGAAIMDRLERAIHSNQQ